MWTDGTSCTHQGSCCYFQNPVGSCETEESCFRVLPGVAMGSRLEGKQESGGEIHVLVQLLLNPGLKWREMLLRPQREEDPQLEDRCCPQPDVKDRVQEAFDPWILIPLSCGIDGISFSPGLC